MHDDGIVDIPFPRTIGDALLREGLAEGINGFPIQAGLRFGCGATRICSTQHGSCDCRTFRYALKTAADPRKLFSEAAEELQLTARFKSLLEQSIPSRKTQESAKALTA